MITHDAITCQRFQKILFDHCEHLQNPHNA